MRVLFLTYDFPYPTTSGGKARAYNMMKYAMSGVELTLFSFIRPGFNPDWIHELKKIGVKDIEVFERRKVRDIRNLKTFLTNESLFKLLYYDPSVAKRIREIVEAEKIEVIHYESFYTACYMNYQYAGRGVKQIYGSENIEHLLYQDYATYKAPLPLRPVFRLQAKKIRKEEETLAKEVDAVLAVTESEKKYFETVSAKKAYVIENGVAVDDFAFEPRTKKEGKTILFVGNFDYFPNADAVSFFYRHVFKQLTDPQLRFVIVGKGAKQFEEYGDKRIEMIEFIPDIKDAYYNADIFVSPIQIGGGTNFKILEAMACGLPVVSFADRVRDIGAVNERDVLTADSPEAFKKQVERLIEDTALAEKLAKNARKIIEEKYSWEKIGKNLNTIWKSL